MSIWRVMLAVVVVVSGATDALAQNRWHRPDRHPLIQRLVKRDRVELNARNVELPLTISKPGSYVLTSDLHATGDGIYIASDDVTIDLNGYTLHGSGGDSIGISPVLISPLTEKIEFSNIAIRNGGIEGFGDYGVLGFRLLGGRPPAPELSIRLRQLVISDLRVRECETAIQCDGAIVEDCHVRDCRDGIIVFSSLVRNCVVERGEVGISAQSGSLAEGCVVTSMDFYGMGVSSSRAVSCEVYRCFTGVQLGSFGVLEDSHVSHSDPDSFGGVVVIGERSTAVVRGCEIYVCRPVGINFGSARSGRVYNNIVLWSGGIHPGSGNDVPMSLSSETAGPLDNIVDYIPN
ncbi:MAG: hypothetical protein ACF8GE_01580 [Phycisphaerales bacterium JB043]